MESVDEKIDIMESGSNQIELIDFRMFDVKNNVVHEGIYGINIAKVKEIIKYPDVVKIPSKDPLIDGIYNLRGEVIPIINLAKWLSIEEPDGIESKKVIITMFNNVIIGFIIHDAKRIRRVSWRYVNPPNDVLLRQYGNKIIGTINLDEKHIMLILDFENICEELGIFSDEDTKKIHRAADGLDIKKKIRIMIADDSNTARKIIKNAISPLALNIIETQNGQEAWDKLEELYGKTGNIKDFVDLIITDVEMPQMDGYRLTKLIKLDDRFKELPVIMNTSLSGNANMQKAKDIGVDAFCTKFIADEFIKTVSMFV